jgi:hypothetical protein
MVGNCPSVGSVKLRGVVGQPVDADLIQLPVRMVGGEGWLSVLCALCEEVNEDMILPSSVVDRLHDMRNSTNVNNIESFTESDNCAHVNTAKVSRPSSDAVDSGRSDDDSDVEQLNEICNSNSDKFADDQENDPTLVKGFERQNGARVVI